MNERLQAACETGINVVRNTALLVALSAAATGSVTFFEAALDGISAHQMRCDSLTDVYRPRACKQLDKRVNDELVDALTAFAVGLAGGGIAIGFRRPASSESEQPQVEEKLAA